MITITDKQACSGCGACANACPKQCIAMTPDADGFEYPEVDRERCVECHLCERMCGPGPKRTDALETRAFGAKSQSLELRWSSSSGGTFTLMSERILEKGGVVYGAAIGKDAVVEHIRAADMDALLRLRRSKYVQSRMGNAYRQAKDDLSQGLWVLFTGTPCQIGGLRNFLAGENTEKLVCQDIICHGVPPYKLWKKHLRELGFEGDADINFRKKATGWNYGYHLEISDEKRTYSKTFQDDPYGAAYLTNLMLRPSCHHCQYSGRNWRSDITLADFWGVERALPDFADDLGVSLALVHTQKGMELFDEAAPFMHTQQVDVESALWGNRFAVAGTKPHPKRNLFLQKIDHASFKRLAITYARGPLPIRMLRRLKNRLMRIRQKL